MRVNQQSISWIKFGGFTLALIFVLTFYSLGMGERHSFGKIHDMARFGNFLSNDIPVTHGVMAGDVQRNSAVIWARTIQSARMNVMVKSRGGYGRPIFGQTHVGPDRDFTGKVHIQGLRPNAAYEYFVWFGNSKKWPKAGWAGSGSFRTPPKEWEAKPISFAWGGDVAGQNVCRDMKEGFPIFKAIREMELDFFVGLGDMIYADNTCEAVGRYGNSQIPGNFVQSADLQNFWEHWKYAREESNLQQLLSEMPYYPVWDDHEVVNDFGPLHDTRETPPYTPGVHLLPIGLRAFLDYNPIAEKALTPNRLYRSVRWGKHVEMIFLDNRQYRDANLIDDDSHVVKTMLGREQLNWLKRTIQSSDATWKVIVSSVPISIPTGFPPELGRDGWANFDQDGGFEYELHEIFNTLQNQKHRNVVFITTDVHFAEVFRYTPIQDDPSFQVYEFVTGPANAGLFPNRAFDDTFKTESIFFYGPESSDSVKTWEEAKPWMNFGYAEVDGPGNLTVSIRNISGNSVFETTLSPEGTY